MAGQDEAIARLEERLGAHEHLCEERDRTRDRALEMAARTLDDRLDKMNELRNMVTEMQRYMLTREEYDRAHGMLVDRLLKIENQQAAETGGVASRYTLLLVCTVVLTLAGLIFTTVHLITS